MSADAEPRNPDEGICLGCGALVEQMPESGVCPSCGRPIMRRQARYPLGLSGTGQDPEPSGAAMPPEVEAAARQPENAFAGKYILVRKIAGGGMGWIWKAWEVPLARFVAIKFLRAPGGEDVLRFEREAQLAASLNHPNILPVYEFGRSRGQYFLVMKFVDGPALNAVTLEGPDLLQVMVPVCQAVHHAHEAGVIHRDLKPANIMLTEKGWPYVLDFSLAKQVQGGDDLSISGMVLGTPQYMSPEQAAGRKDVIDRRSDVYGLGATLYCLVTGRPPFGGESPMDILMNVMKEEVVPPRRLKSKVAPPLEAVILKALEKDPARRYATAAELAEDLQRLSSGKTVIARPPRPRLVPRFLRQNAPLSAALGVAALLAVTLTFLATRRPVAVPGSSDPRLVWWDEFRRAQADFRPGDKESSARAEAIGTILKRAPAALGTRIGEAAQWFRDQAKPGRERLQKWESAKRSEWWSHREEAHQLRLWARAMLSLLDGQPVEFADARRELEDLAARADPIASFRGTATLRINVHPYPTIRSFGTGKRWLIRDGKIEDPTLGSPSDPDLSSPLVIRQLEIDDYEVELFHPEHGSRKISLRLENGREYLLMGRMAEERGLDVREVP